MFHRTLLSVLRILPLCAAFFLVSGCSGDTERQRVVRIGIGFNEQMPQHQALVVFKEHLESLAGDRFRVEIFHSGQLGDDRSMMEALRMGNQEMTVPATAPMVGFVREFQVLDLPYLFPSFEVMHDVLDGPLGRELLDKLDGVGLHGLVFLPEGFRSLTNNRRPVRRPEDLRGLRIRTMENRLHMQAFREWGANPTSMAFSEIFSALEQGVVDGQENPPAVPWNSNFHEVQRFFSDTRHFAAPYVMLVSGRFWNRLSEEDRAHFQAAARAAYEAHRTIVATSEVEVLNNLRRVMEFVELSDDDRRVFFEAARPVYDQARSNLGDDFVNRFLQAAGHR